MAATSQQALAGATPAQEILPIAGTIIGDFFGPIGGLAGKEIGTAAGNTIATGDFAGAATGTPASNQTNMGGLFQGQGLEGLIKNFLLPQLTGGPSAGKGGGSMGMLQGLGEMRGGIGGPSVGEGYTGGANTNSAQLAGLAGTAMSSPAIGSLLGTGGGSIDSLLASYLGGLF
jgi:hypothetical protein